MDTTLSSRERAETTLHAIQDLICSHVESVESGGNRFVADIWERKTGGGGESRVLTGGETFEQAGVNFSSVFGDALPPAATARKPELAGRPFCAMGVSVVLHPNNPYVPTSHFNVRYFEAGDVWWFGGGFDLTPYYGNVDDCRAWHAAAQRAAGEHYPEFKAECDQYFYLPHRKEARGIGGIFFDDYNSGGFDNGLALIQRTAQEYAKTYAEIVAARRDTAFGERERQFQLYRRGRYVEFNLVYDRGTLFGLQSGGRTESILMSMPPLVRWQYDWAPEPGTPEAALYTDFLPARDWLGLNPDAAT